MSIKSKKQKILRLFLPPRSSLQRYWVTCKKIEKIIRVRLKHILGLSVVYFDQHLGAVHLKRWSMSSYFCKKAEKGRKSKKIDAKFFKVCTRTLVKKVNVTHNRHYSFVYLLGITSNCCYIIKKLATTCCKKTYTCILLIPI